MTKKILIVDDEEINRIILRKIVETSGRIYQIFEAKDGFDALEAVMKHNPDLVFLDIMMPRMDGLMLCEILRGTKRWQHIQIIFQSALTSQEDIKRGIEAGAFGYLEKPINKDQVVKLLNEVFVKELPTFQNIDPQFNFLYSDIIDRGRKLFNVITGKTLEITNATLLNPQTPLKKWDITGSIQAKGETSFQVEMGWSKEMANSLYQSFLGSQPSNDDEASMMILEVLNMHLGSVVKDISETFPVKLDVPHKFNNHNLMGFKQNSTQFHVEYQLDPYHFETIITVQ